MDFTTVSCKRKRGPNIRQQNLTNTETLEKNSLLHSHGKTMKKLISISEKNSVLIITIRAHYLVRPSKRIAKNSWGYSKR